MKVSFFQNGNDILGADYSYTPDIPDIPAVLDEETGEIITPMIPGVPAKGHPDCIAVFDIDFDPTTQIATLIDGEVVITDRPTPPESPQEKRERVKQAFIHCTNIDEFDLEGVVFDGINEIDEIITAKAFGGDNGAQMALATKAILALAMQDAPKIATLLGDPRLALTNQIRIKLGLSSLL